MSQVITCKACKGTGVTKFKHPVSGRPGEVSCSTCGGSGKVPHKG